MESRNSEIIKGIALEKEEVGNLRNTYMDNSSKKTKINLSTEYSETQNIYQFAICRSIINSQNTKGAIRYN